MVGLRFASLPDARSSLDCRVAERLDFVDSSPAASALDFCGEHPSLYPNGDVRADSQVRVLAFLVRGRMVGARSHREMYVRGGLSASAVETRGGRLARVTGELASGAAEERADGC